MKKSSESSIKLREMFEESFNDAHEDSTPIEVLLCYGRVAYDNAYDCWLENAYEEGIVDCDGNLVY